MKFPLFFFFFFNDTATTEIYTLSLHDALPISSACWPVPLPTSRTLRLAANSVLRTSRIGPLLRSQASDSVSTARVCDNAPMQAIDALLQRRSARELTDPAPDES